MKKSALLFVILINGLTLIPSHAQTDVSGIISTSTTWTASGSPYIISGNVIVPSELTLIVESDVVVRFQSNTGLYVNGTLQATSAQFISDNSSPQRGDWDFIQIGDGWNYSGTASFTTCIIRYGGTGTYRGNGIFRLGDI